MGANKPKLTIVNKKHLSTATRKTRAENEKRLYENAPSEEAQKPPAWLSKEAKKIYKELSKKQYEINLISDLDRDALALYCDAYDKVRRLNVDINKEGMILEDGKVNPKINIRQKYLNDVLTLSKEFGLTPSSRLRFTLAQNNLKAIDKKEQEFNSMFGGI